MRTASFLVICGLIAGGIVLGIKLFLAWIELQISYVDWIVFDLIKFAVFMPIVVLMLTPVNKKIRNWRKMRGRDIEAEEKYETESGFISLTEKENK